MAKQTSQLLASIFPESQPIDVLLERCVARQPELDWLRIPRDSVATFGDWSCPRLICKECLPPIRWLEPYDTSFEPYDYLMMSVDILMTPVDILRYRCREIGTCDDVSFWLPVTVWLGICERCGTVYWDRD